MKTKIFISGSRKISRLNDEIRNRLQNVIDQQMEIIIGDANGVDKAVQKYLSDIQYQHVKVFCSGTSCRNNLGNWEINYIDVDPKLKGREFYTQKDKAMAFNATYGFVLWDGKSVGSYNNIIELVKNEKKALVYFSPEKEFYSISNLSELDKLLKEFNQPSSNFNESKGKKINSMPNKLNSLQEYMFES